MEEVDSPETVATGESSTMPMPAAGDADSKISYDDGVEYWESVNADLDGIMGGFPQITKVDLQGSKNFLAKLGIGLKDGQKRVQNALEGGAGIGRITEGLLLKIADTVDVVEPVVKFTDALKGKEGVGAVYNVGLQDWKPATNGGSGAKPGDEYYDLIWNQWCLGHLTDTQLVQYLQRCKTVLRPETGMIIVKENISKNGVDIFDETDSSVTREDKKFTSIFEEAGLRLVKSEYQRGLPKKLYPVKMYALKPAAS